MCFNQTTCDICEENYGFLGDDCVICPPEFNLTNGYCIGKGLFEREFFWFNNMEIWKIFPCSLLL